MKTKGFATMLLAAALLLSACANSPFSTAFDQYKQTYLSATAFIANDPPGGYIDDLLRKLDIQAFEADLLTMQQAVEQMDQSARSSTEKDDAHIARLNIKDLQDLLKARKNLENLTADDFNYAITTTSLILDEIEYYTKGKKAYFTQSDD